MTAAYQINAYQNNAYQTAGGVFIPAFDGCAFQFDAFQAAPCPFPPPPTPIYDGHDGGKNKKAIKKLQELENKRIELARQDAENRKMAIRFAIDPQAKAEHEAKIAKLAVQGKPVVKDNSKEIAKIDAEIARIERLKNNLKIQPLIRAELARIHTEREIRENEVRRQIKMADEELALMMLMN